MQLVSLHLDTQLDENRDLLSRSTFFPAWKIFGSTDKAAASSKLLPRTFESAAPVSRPFAVWMHNLVFEEDVITEDEAMALVRSSRCLIQFKMPILDLTAKVSLALFESTSGDSQATPPLYLWTRRLHDFEQCGQNSDLLCHPREVCPQERVAQLATIRLYRAFKTAMEL